MMLQTSHENQKAGGQGTPGHGVCNRFWDRASFQGCPQGAVTNCQGECYQLQMDGSGFPSMKASACSFRDAFLKSVPQTLHVSDFYLLDSTTKDPKHQS